MTSALTERPVLQGTGEVDLSLRAGGTSSATIDAPAAPTWASRVRPGSGALQPSLSQETVDRAIEEMELRQLYDDLTEEEWKAIHNPDDREEHGYTLAEALRTGDLKAKWVKSIGGPVHIEEKNGVKAETWARGNLVLFEVTQPDGEKQKWICSTTRGIRYQLGEQGEVICTAGEYDVAMRQTKETYFADCSISDNLPSINVPISGEVNNRKGKILAAVLPDGQIIINARGIFNDHQFVAKTREGAFVTVDSKGNPMLADLDKLPADVALSDQDRQNHEAIAQQIKSGQRSVTEFIRLGTEQDRIIRPGFDRSQLDELKPAKGTPCWLKTLSDLDRRGGLANTPNDLDVVFAQGRIQRQSHSR